MSKAKLEAARELITEKKYAEARQILHTIPDNDVAQRWLSKLDQIAPNNQTVLSRSQSGLKQKATSSSPQRSFLPVVLAIVVTLLVIAAAVVGVVALSSRNQQVAEVLLPTVEASITPQEESSGVPTDYAEFTNYIREKYRVISNMRLEVQRVFVIDEEYPGITIFLTEPSAETFALQSRFDIEDYMESLFEDASKRFVDTEFLARVEYETYLPVVTDAIKNTDGVEVLEFQDGRGWRTNVTLSRAFNLDGIKNIDILLPDVDAQLVVSATATPSVVSSEGDYQQYIRQNYNSIGGRPLGILAVALIDGGAGIVLESERDIELFVNQSADTKMTYMNRLYTDVSTHYGENDTAVFVVATLPNIEITPELRASDWILIGEPDASGRELVTLTLARRGWMNGNDIIHILSADEYETLRNPQAVVILPTNTAVIIQATAAPTSVPLTASSTQPSPAAGMTEAQFEQYVTANYGTINGVALEIERVTAWKDYYGSTSLSVNLTPQSAIYVFADQTEAAATEYAERLYNDAYAFFGDVDFLVSVGYTDYTDDLQDYHYDEEWWYIGDYDLDDGWYVSRDYIKMFYIEGRKSAEIWNYK